MDRKDFKVTVSDASKTKVVKDTTPAPPPREKKGKDGGKEKGGKD